MMKKFIILIVLAFTSTCYAQSYNQINQQIQGTGKRMMKMSANNHSMSFGFVYKNGSPYGKNARISYDTFYKNYTIVFFKQDGSKTSCIVTDSNFISEWEFKYNGSVYQLSN